MGLLCRRCWYPLTNVDGTAAEAALHYILRDFELDGLAAHGELLLSVCDAVQLSDPRLQVECTITPQYRNMRYWLEEDMRPVELAMQAMQAPDLVPCPLSVFPVSSVTIQTSPQAISFTAAVAAAPPNPYKPEVKSWQARSIGAHRGRPGWTPRKRCRQSWT